MRTGYPQQGYGCGQPGLSNNTTNNNNGMPQNGFMQTPNQGYSMNGYHQNQNGYGAQFGMPMNNPYTSSNLIGADLTLNSQRQTPTSTYQMQNQTFNYEYYNNSSKNLASNSSFNSGSLTSRKKEDDPFKSLLSFK